MGPTSLCREVLRGGEALAAPKDGLRRSEGPVCPWFVPGHAGTGCCASSIPGWLMCVAVGRLSFCTDGRFSECPWFRVAMHPAGDAEAEVR
jgi:hypothetical protein